MSFLKHIFSRRKAPLDEAGAAASDSFCIMPWVHLHVTQHGTVTPCCQAPWEEEHGFGNVNRDQLRDIWKGRGMQEFRRTMLCGEKDKRCERCYLKEASGFTSLRQVTNQKFAQHIPQALQSQVPENPVYWDIRFSNVCNFKCRICGPWSSSKWYNDAVALGMASESAPALTQAAEDPADFMAQLEGMAVALEEIYFAGGEPLIMQEHYALLDMLIEKGMTDVRLQYNTNFSLLRYKGRDVVDLWRQFPNVTLSLSLDGMGPRGELQRSLQSWPQTIHNIERLRREAPHVEVIVSPTLSVFNLLHLPEFHRAWTARGYIRPETFFPSLLVQPEHYNIRILPAQLKAQAVELYREHTAWLKSQEAEDEGQMRYCLARFQEVESHLQSADHSHLLPVFTEKCAALDELRGESVREVFPELAVLWG